MRRIVVVAGVALVALPGRFRPEVSVAVSVFPLPRKEQEPPE